MLGGLGLAELQWCHDRLGLRHPRIRRFHPLLVLVRLAAVSNFSSALALRYC